MCEALHVGFLCGSAKNSRFRPRSAVAAPRRRPKAPAPAASHSEAERQLRCTQNPLHPDRETVPENNLTRTEQHASIEEVAGKENREDANQEQTPVQRPQSECSRCRRHGRRRLDTLGASRTVQLDGKHRVVGARLRKSLHSWWQARFRRRFSES